MSSEIPKNEIDDILNAVLNHKKLIIGVVIIFLLISYFYAFFIQKAIYQGDILIKIAQNNTNIVENEESLVQILRNKYKIDNSKKPMPFITNVIKPKYSQGVVMIYAEGYAKSTISKLLGDKLVELSKEHNISVQRYISDQKKIILNTQQNIDDMEKERDDFISQNRFMESNLEKSSNCAYAVTLLRNDNSILKLNNLILKQKNFLIALNTTLQPNRTFTTKIKGKIHINPKPITPSKKLIIVSGIISGLLLGILLSLFLQFLRDRGE